MWVTIPFQEFCQPSRCKVAINLRELTSLTNSFSLQYVKGCEATLIKSNPKELAFEYKVVCHKADSDPSGHIVRIQFDLSGVTADSKLNGVNVKCSCGCPAFLYWGAQWNLHEKDALEGPARPLLQAPTKDLQRRQGFMICKHVKVVADRILPAATRVLNDMVRRLQVENYKRREEEEARLLEQEVQQKKEKNRLLRQKQRDRKKGPHYQRNRGIIE